MKISKLSTAKINTLIDELHKEIDKRNAAVNLKSEIDKMLDKSGYTIFDIIGTKKITRVAPKWRHKEDKNLTWAGRGRQPKWIKKYGVKI